MASQAQGFKPELYFVYPTADEATFGRGVDVRLVAGGTLPNDAKLTFYANAFEIGTITGPPFAAFWNTQMGIEVIGGRAMATLKVVATYSSGIARTSPPVNVFIRIDPPPWPIVKIMEPTNNCILPAGSSVPFVAEIFATLDGEREPGVEFYVDGKLVDAVKRKGRPFDPYVTTVNALPPGEHDFAVKYIGGNASFCRCQKIRVKVVEVGLCNAFVDPKGSIGFDVVTSFPGAATVVERSTNLLQWMPVQTNYPIGKSFHLQYSPDPLARNGLFYKVVSFPSRRE